jgi:hypothetical protein
VTYKGTSNGVAVFEVGSGRYRFLAAEVAATSENADVSATVPATLALALANAQLGTLQPGVARDYSAEIAGTVTSTAGDAALDVHDPSANRPGHLVNGSHALPQALQAKGTGAFAPIAGASNPTRLLSYTAPVASAPLTIGLKQSVAADDALRTGTYAKTLVFTLSTTSP